jgi:hypothetical protein
MKPTTKLVWLFVLLLAFSLQPLAFSQGTAFTYQGQLTIAGSPANGSYDLTFALFDSLSGGSQQGSTITSTGIAVNNGLLTVTLDFGNQFPGTNRWLEIGVRTNGGGAFATLSPRQQLTSTPYAVQSANAAAASSVAAGNITGTFTTSQLPSAVVTNGASGVSFTGSFSGNGLGITNVNLVLLSGGSISWGRFSAVLTNTVGISPYSVTAADVNGDGRPDLICANFGGSSLSVLTNNGNGGFVAILPLTVGNAPYSVAAADVNGDGKVDLISANSGASTLTVLTNKGSSGFVLATNMTVGASPRAVVAADVNGDGKMDLISANFSANTLSVLTNNGSGGFVLASTVSVGTGPQSVAAADINGDGKLDLICANSGGTTLSVLLGNGNGTFIAAPPITTAVAPQSVTAADVNGDGWVDLICTLSPSTLEVFLGNGPGTFGPGSFLTVGSGPLSVVAADVNGDGKVDLISVNNTAHTLSVLTNNGRGGFALAASLGVGNGPRSVVAADLNGDGKLDLVSANSGDNTLTVLLNTVLFNGSFSGNGSALTNLNASQLTSGTVPATRLAGSGVSGQNSFQFGAGLAGQDINAGKIGYEAFSPDSLDIVGAGTNASNRKITFWAEGGANFTGPVSATSLSGNGSGLTNLNASQFASGTVADALLSSNVALRAGGNAFSGSQTVSGSVGIGTTSTNFPLNLGQTLGDKLALYDDGNGQGYGFGITNLGLQIHADTPQADIIFGTGSSSNLSEVMRVKGNGNVGIGNSSPVSPLSFANTLGEKIAFYTSTNGTITNTYGFGVQTNELEVHTDTPAADIVFGTGDSTHFTETMRIRGNGYVGISTYPNLPFNYLVVGPYTNPAYCDGFNWNNSSDRTMKENFAAIDPAQILDQVLSLPISSWSYKASPDDKHIGPVAQGFHAAFGLNGADDKHVSTLDEDGVALAAIQGLNQKLAQEDAELKELKARLARLEKLLNQKLDKPRK